MIDQYRMNKHVLDAVFSLLPKSNADTAIRHIIELARKPKSLTAFEIRWAEFELDGRFLRGGLSDISDLSIIMFTNSQSDFGINMLARRAAQADFSPGLMDWSDDHEWFLWYLPFRHTDHRGNSGTRLRGLLVGNELFAEIIELFNKTASLTVAEKRTVFQLVGGLELREAARIDNVVYETKRAHSKSACDKLGYSGQKDLVRNTLGQLFHLMSVSDSELQHVEPAVEFTEKFLADDMKFAAFRDESGTNLRYLVGGPAAGRPVVLVHGMMFPVILKGIAPFLEQHNLRLYVPIRPGYLESRALGTLFDYQDLIQRSVRDFAVFVQKQCLAPVTLIGNSLGAPTAYRMALQYPTLVSHLILISPNLAAPANDSAEVRGSFYEGMQSLKSDTLLFKLVNLEYRRYYSNPATCKHILNTHFAKSETDIKVMEGQYTGYPVYEMFASAYPSSIVGIAEDFRTVIADCKCDVRRLRMPVHIIHGEQDPLTTINEVAMAFNIPDEEIARAGSGSGHFASISHGDKVWGMVAQICAAQPVRASGYGPDRRS